MGLFRRSSSEARVAAVQRLALKVYRDAGIDGAVIPTPGDPVDIAIMTPSGTTYGLANITIACLELPRSQWRARISEHVRQLLSASAEPAFDLSEPGALHGIRSRLLPDGGMPTSIRYARAFAPGLVEALCVDLPNTVMLLEDSALVGHDVDALFRLGREQLHLEPVEAPVEVIEGLSVVIGDSLFTASQVLNPGFLSSVSGTAASTFVFFVPDRHRLYFVPLEGPNVVAAVTQLGRLASQLDERMLPGQLLSRDLYFTDGDEVQRITATDAGTGELQILAHGPFLDAVNRAVAS